MEDIYNLQRFVDAQDRNFEGVIRELKSGRKHGHWMWYVFPQIRGLGRSETAKRFAISSVEEAKAYLKHPILGPRLLQCTQLVNAIEGRSIEQIFDFPDYMKFRSSMTLFAYASEDSGIFTEALDKYFNGNYDDMTLDILRV